MEGVLVLRIVQRYLAALKCDMVRGLRVLLLIEQLSCHCTLLYRRVMPDPAFSQASSLLSISESTYTLIFPKRVPISM